MMMTRTKEIIISLIAWISGLSTFITLGSLILFLSLFVNPNHFSRFIKACCRCIVRSLFIRVKVKGRDLLYPNQTYLFMANHVNLFDVFVLYGYIPHFCRAVELDDHFTWPFYGRIIRRLGMIPISQTRARSALNSLNRAKEVLSKGISIIILPEGHRTLDGRLGPFQRGAFRLAKEGGVDIAPMALIGAFKINRKGSLLIRPGNMVLRFGEPVSYSDIGDLDVDQIRSMVQHKVFMLLTDGNTKNQG